MSPQTLAKLNEIAIEIETLEQRAARLLNPLPNDTIGRNRHQEAQRALWEAKQLRAELYQVLNSE